MALVIMAGPVSAQGLTCTAPHFVATEITPQFPPGLTVDDALGQWRDAATGKVIKEPSKELRLIVPAKAEKDIKEKIDAIVAVYKQRFQQQAVGIAIRPACASF